MSQNVSDSTYNFLFHRTYNSSRNSQKSHWLTRVVSHKLFKAITAHLGTGSQAKASQPQNLQIVRQAGQLPTTRNRPHQAVPGRTPPGAWADTSDASIERKSQTHPTKARRHGSISAVVVVEFSVLRLWEVETIGVSPSCKVGCLHPSPSWYRKANPRPTGCSPWAN